MSEVQGVYSVIIERRDEGPTLLEAVGERSSYRAARLAYERAIADKSTIRACIVIISPLLPPFGRPCGNHLAYHDMIRMQGGDDD